jgi:hypothetical protein
MPLAGFEPTIPVFKRAKTFHVLDCAATDWLLKYLLYRKKFKMMSTNLNGVPNFICSNASVSCAVFKMLGVVSELHIQQKIC